MNIIEFLDAPQLNPAGFDGGTRGTMRSVLKAAWALPMDDKDLAAFAKVSGGRKPPSRRVNELWIIAGMRGEKSRTAGYNGTYCATIWAELGDIAKKLKPGERAYVSVVSMDRSQSKLAYGYMRGQIESSPVLSQMVDKYEAEAIHFNNGVTLEVSTNNFRSIRGRTRVAVILDEVAFFRNENAANPDVEVYRAAKPGLVTLDGMLIGISSPYGKRGLLHQKYKKHFGKDDDSVLVVQGASRDFNPTIPQSVIDEAMADDPQRASADWLGQFRNDLETFIQREVIEQAVRTSPLELPYDRKHKYSAFVDASGGGRDEFGLAIGHREGDNTIVDLIRARRGVPAEITAGYADLLKSYGLSKVTGDKYAGSWPADEFKKHGIDYIPADKSKSDLYVDALPAFNSGRVEIPPDDVLVNQLINLERKTSRAGKDSIDHAPGGHDDRANVVAGLIATKSASNYDLRKIVGVSDDSPQKLRRDRVSIDSIRGYGIPLN